MSRWMRVETGKCCAVKFWDTVTLLVLLLPSLVLLLRLRLGHWAWERLLLRQRTYAVRDPHRGHKFRLAPDVDDQAETSFLSNSFLPLLLLFRKCASTNIRKIQRSYTYGPAIGSIAKTCLQPYARMLCPRL